VATDANTAERFPLSHNPERLQQVGAEACRECHAEIVDQWYGSHHELANRPIDRAIDTPAFAPPRVVEDIDSRTVMTVLNDQLTLSFERTGEENLTYPLEGVIGLTPLRQYLAPFPGGRWQVASASYDPAKDEWFEVFESEGRLPGEWGHWTGQGMNWNANCAYCHMTEYKKDYDWERDTYQSKWLRQGIDCIACHAGVDAHMEAARAGIEEPPIVTMEQPAVEASCARCHSRRDQLTPDAFEPGDAFHQHFNLALSDQPGLYYPDGQILDEVFVYTSFRGSRMGHSGVTCTDCHDPHTLKTILPVENNALCMRCHSSGLDNAPIIEPLQHSFHQPGSTGTQCVACHMPETPYMQRDPRRDHGFLLPDPLMTQRLGIPNACSNCHADESLEWAVEWSEKWYGEKLAKSRQRQRAEAIHAAYNNLEEAKEKLLAAGETADIPYWRATYAGLLRDHGHEPDAAAWLRAQLDHENPIVRERALRSLVFAPGGVDLARAALQDESRSVRLTAMGILFQHGETVTDPALREEWQAYLEFNADRPQSAIMLAMELYRKQQTRTAKAAVEHATKLDRGNPELLRQAAVIMSIMNDPAKAEEYLLTATALNPDNPMIYYSLALLLAEKGEMQAAIDNLQAAVKIDPGFTRAWYNLALALTKLERWQEASESLEQARPAMANDPNWQRTRQIIDMQLQSTK